MNSTVLKGSNTTSDFSVYSLEVMDDKTNTYYSHWSEGLTMYITKDGVTMKLESEEIQQLVKALPRTVGGTY